MRRIWTGDGFSVGGSGFGSRMMRSGMSGVWPRVLCWWRGLAVGRMPKVGESWMPRIDWRTVLGLGFRVPLACAPGGSAPPLMTVWVAAFQVIFHTDHAAGGAWLGNLTGPGN